MDRTLEADRPMTPCGSLIELVHPDGVVKRSLIIGSNCPAMLCAPARVQSSECVDLVVLAPTVTECRTKGWLHEALRLLDQRLATNGLAYVLAPRCWRVQIAWRLYRQGLSIAAAIVHLPNWEASRHLVPLNLIAVRYAFSNMIATPFWRRWIALIGLRFPGAERLLGAVLPSAALLAHRPYARPFFAWLFDPREKGSAPGCALINTSWRGPEGAVILYRFSRRDIQPSAVAKMTLMASASTNHVAEAAILARLGPSARRAGARVPRPLRLTQIGGRPVLLQTATSGQSVAALLAANPGRLVELVKQIASWLECWNRSTLTVIALTMERLTQAVLEPVAILAPLLEQGEEYRVWLTQRCGLALGTEAPFVASHNDLTMSNILLDRHGRLAVVDWQTGSQQGLPLADFFYAVTDAVVVAQCPDDRLSAFETCFARQGRYVDVVAGIQQSLMRATHIRADLAVLYFHACWLHHGLNELRASKASEPRPFLKIVQWLALNYGR